MSLDPENILKGALRLVFGTWFWIAASNLSGNLVVNIIVMMISIGWILGVYKIEDE